MSCWGARCPVVFSLDAYPRRRFTSSQIRSLSSLFSFLCSLCSLFCSLEARRARSNSSFNPNPLRCFVQTCCKLLQYRLTIALAAGRVNSSVRRPRNVSATPAFRRSSYVFLLLGGNDAFRDRKSVVWGKSGEVRVD